VVTGLNFLLIPVWGAYGAAWATLLAFLVRFVTVYITAQRAYPLPYDWPRISMLLAAVGILGFVGTVWSHLAGLVVSISVGVIAVVLFAAVGYRFGLSSQDRRLIPAAIRLAVGRSAVN
jgi:O-antigen/teichoic acid export membrane protein